MMDTDANRYRMDADLLPYLYQWAQSGAPFGAHDAIPYAAMMIAHLETLDRDDADYLLSHGWTRVFDDMQATRKGNARADITLSTGTLVRHVRVVNGCQHAYGNTSVAGEMTPDEWTEYCATIRTMGGK
jgi:hypothetical protein